ncbi:DsbA family protein [Spirillospora sp. NPDC048911]|uniref:DsbA family oxidoreductase n=1 Tax=Spirillospora sp. NPDC048911 TaxID=3364527 RepID=UPI00371BB492
MKVEIAHDIACVWSALGFARFRRAADEHRAGGAELEVTFRPYDIAETHPAAGTRHAAEKHEAVGTQPAAGTRHAAETYGVAGAYDVVGVSDVAGASPGRVHPQLASAARAERIVRAAAVDGLVMNLDRIVPADTFHAHRLIAAAAVHGTAEDMAVRLYRAYFTDGLDIADAGVLRSLASVLGVPWNGELLDARLARSGRGSGPRVPVFRFPDGTVLVGAVSLAALRNELRQATCAAA